MNLEALYVKYLSKESALEKTTHPECYEDIKAILKEWKEKEEALMAACQEVVDDVAPIELPEKKPSPSEDVVSEKQTEGDIVKEQTVKKKAKKK